MAKLLIFSVLNPDYAGSWGDGARDAVGHGELVGAINHYHFDDGQILLMVLLFPGENKLIVFL